MTHPPSSVAKSQPSAPQKAHTVSLVSSTPPLRNDLNQMMLHPPVETAGTLGAVHGMAVQKAEIVPAPTRIPTFVNPLACRFTGEGGKSFLTRDVAGDSTFEKCTEKATVSDFEGR
jgi:hypothetical protein